ncbi:MAG: glycoside hydrolase domain-containing protein [Verrucomicrobiia bacterium]
MKMMRVVLWVMVFGVITEALAMEPLRLIAPWTPVTVKTNASVVEVGVWGRSHKFAGAALPTSIVTAGGDVLAAPIRLVGQVSGKDIAWKRGGNFVFHADKAHAIISGWQAGDDLIVNTTTQIEFDGVMRVDLVVMPQNKKSPKIERLWLEVPLKRSCASLYHFWPGRWGGAKNSGAVPDAGLQLPFKPFVWLGWEDGGLGWFTESDKGWQPQDPKQPIEVVVIGDQTVLRLHLLDSPPPRLPLTYTLGFHASPVKPWPKDFHEWRICHGASYGMEKKPLKAGEKKTALDRTAELGVKTLVFHEHWTPFQNHPLTTHEASLKSLVAASHKRGIKLLLYHGYEFSSLAPEWGEMADETLVKNASGGYTGGYYRTPEQRDYIVCYNSRYRDFLLDGVAKALARYGYDGVYLDGTIEPWGCCNERHGCGYRAPDGTLKPTYPVFAVRRLMHGLAERAHPRGGLVNAHQSTCCTTPTLAFADSYWDGEQFGGGELTRDLLKQLPLETFRAEFMGRNFGVPAEYLVYERPPQWTFDAALAFTMLHDVRVRPGGVGEPLEKMSVIWKVMTRFGVEKAQWHPYWEMKPLATAQPESVKASLYVRPSTKGKNGRTLLVVSNLSGDQPAAAQVKLDRAGLKLRATAGAKDALSGEILGLTGDVLTVPVPPMRMRMVWVE